MDIRHSRQAEFFDERAETWDDGAHHDQKVLEQILRLLDLRHGDAVLDVGTGTGVMIPYLLRDIGDSGQIVAVDFSRNMIAVARRKFPKDRYPNVTFVVQDVNDMPVEDEFDAILLYSCFPHFLDQPASIRHMTKGLKSGGRLMIAHSESRDAINEKHKDEEGNVQEEYLPSLLEIEGMMKSAGLKGVVRVDTDEMFVVAGEKA
jgi:demethylmenaquinone methyltransferase/2-methoxy-6-polyprenyl-1,4-benzoquinol methylase